MTTLQPSLDTRSADAPQASSIEADHISLVTLTRVELRKLADTRAGFWLLLVIGLAAAGTAAILLAAAPEDQQTFRDLLSFGLLPASILLPVLGILSMTSEWSQRTALTTFTLMPQRGRVIAAKLLACVLIALVATVAAAALSAVANLIAISIGGDGSWHLTADQTGRMLISQVISVLMGAGFGALLMNPALAIVLYFAVPTVWSVLGEIVKALHTAAGWLDLNVTAAPLSEETMTSGQWGRLGVAVAVWVVVPLIGGTVRVLRREIA